MKLNEELKKINKFNKEKGMNNNWSKCPKELRDLPLIEKQPYDFWTVRTISESTNTPNRDDDHFCWNRCNYNRFSKMQNLAWYW